MVSILEVYRMLAIVMMLMNKRRGCFFATTFPMRRGGDAVMLQGGESRFSGFG